MCTGLLKAKVFYNYICFYPDLGKRYYFVGFIKCSIDVDIGLVPATACALLLIPYPYGSFGLNVLAYYINGPGNVI